jgi:hypothetical protein
MTVTVEAVLRLLAPLTPAVLPVIVLVWHRTRQELRGIRRELVELRQRPLVAEPQLERLTQAVAAMALELERLTEADRIAAPSRVTREPVSSLLRDPMS